MRDVQPGASHFIDGQPVEDTGGAVIEVVFPATGAVIARLHEATPAVIERALEVMDRAMAEADGILAGIHRAGDPGRGPDGAF